MIITKNCNIFTILFIGIFCLSVTNNLPKRFDKDALLARHNFYRKKVGVPALKWSDELAEIAQKWANKLAKKCNLEHSSSEWGENIYWTSGTATATEVVDRWAREEKYFDHTNRVYKSPEGRKFGHYSQIIWRNTTHVGCAVQKCRHGGEIWVCNYDPPGNYIGEPVY